MEKDFILNSLAAIGQIVEYSITDNYLYACVEPSIGYVSTGAFNTLATFNPTSVDIVASDYTVYIKLKVKID